MRTNSTLADRRKYYSRYIAYTTKRSRGLIVLGVLFLIGVFAGTLLLRTAKGESLEFLMQMVGAFVENRRAQSLLQNFTSSAAVSLAFLAVLFVCGFCAISQPLVALLPLFRGLGVGVSMASLYAFQGTRVVGYVALLMLPGTLLGALAILVCSRESLRLSNSFFAVMGGEQPGRSKEFYSLKIYIARYLACAGMCALAAFVEAALYSGFSGFFQFG